MREMDQHRSTDEQQNASLEITGSRSQGKPSELPNLVTETVFVAVVSIGKFLFALFLANVMVNQVTLIDALGIDASKTPWIIGSYLLANGVSVLVAGALADLSKPKILIVGAYAWLTVWNIIGTFSITPSRNILFFVARAMQGLGVGLLASTAMSVLGRVYQPGIRKTRVFSFMAAMIPLGFGIGAIQGGAFSAHIEWIFGSNLQRPQEVSWKDFDFPGAALAILGSGLVIFGLTQGVPAHWNPYSYALIIIGLLCFVAFYYIERKASRPLIDNRLWKTPGFLPLMVSYFLGYGAFTGGWLFYAVRFFLTTQNQAPITASLYLIPMAVAGSIATVVVSKTLHKVPGHLILISSMVAFALGPTFFLPQTTHTSYWALSFPGIILATFGPDMSFAAASIFITSSVSKSFQGSAGGLLVMIQNLSSAVMTAIGDTIGQEVTSLDGYDLDLDALRAVWWFSLGMSLVGAVICAVFVRIPRSEEKDHVQ